MLGIVINRNSQLQLWRQVYQALKENILNGQLEADEALPSTRELAKELCVSRNTVSEAYDMLISEGFAVSRQGAPTRVAEGLLIGRAAVRGEEGEKSSPSIEIVADFHTGRPDLHEFPRYVWQQLLHRETEELPLAEFGYSSPQGDLRLRKEISAWLYRSRGLSVFSDDIFITAGATHALHLIADLLCTDGRGIFMEDPCHIGMYRTFENKGCRIIPVPVDKLGMRTDCLKAESNACMVYVTPSHQFPLGGILPASRRAEIIRFVRENGIYAVEDDYDSEFRYCGEPVAPLISMDAESVIYVGTFSKTLFPALRIGYVILPRELQERWIAIRTYADVQNPPFEQAALGELLRTRRFDRHVQKMRRLYALRRQTLLDALKLEFGDGFEVFGDAAGLHVAVNFPKFTFDSGFKEKCLKNGIFVTPVENHCIRKGEHQSMLLLGYGHLRAEEIRSAIKLLSSFMKETSGE
ncbi:MAG: PLP-dependent aminotransferase family protein [Firmicutes bacterium HGW-Firmicutes-16]|nr:MAG: PLP-dependent aminotransferase family protein [Firmicutes bacterium HGW-Firmicutes-16]